MMDMTNHRIDNLLNSVEVAIENNIPAINKTISRPDIMEEIARRIVKVNPMISGSAVAFMPNYYKGERTLYCPYSYEDSTGIHSKHLATKEYNYIEKKWFKDAIKVKEGRWTEPYYDEGGGNMVMTTYTHPVFDNDSNIVGQWIDQGYGISLISSFDTVQLFSTFAPEVTVIPIDDPSLQLSLGIARRTDQVYSDTERQLYEFAVHYFTELGSTTEEFWQRYLQKNQNTQKGCPSF